MASYGKLEYWDARYARETASCDWIGDANLVEALLTTEILKYSSAPAPGGHSVGLVTSLPTFPIPLYPTDGIDDEGIMTIPFYHEESRGDVNFPKRKDMKILNVGCGNSLLGEGLLKKKFNNIVNVDYSPVLIKKMKEKYNNDFFVELNACLQREDLLRCTLGLAPKLLHDNERPNESESRDEANVFSADGGGDFPSMAFEHGDIVQGLDYSDESFDLIICKKTLDIVLCGAASIGDTRRMMSECYRLLNKNHGVMIILSSAKPEDRAIFFEQDPWSGVMNIKLPSKDSGRERKGHEKKDPTFYAYVLYKQQPPM